MLHSIVIHPNFFNSLKDNSNLQKHFENFYKKIKHNARDIMFRVDDQNETLKKEYNEIIKNLTPGDSLRMLIEDFFLKQLFVEKININFETSNLDQTIFDLKFINFYFSKVTDIQKKPVFKKDTYLLNKLSKNAFEDLIIGLTRFAKKITFSDPYIAQRMTNLSGMSFEKCKIENIYEKIKKIKEGRSPDDFKIHLNKINNDYKISLRKLLDIIYKNNIFINELKIEILTCIRKDDINKIEQSLSKIKRLHDDEINEDKKKRYFNLFTSIKEQLYYKDEKSNVVGIDKNVSDRIIFALSDTNRPKAKFEIKFVNQHDNEYEGAKFYAKSLIIKGDEKETVVDPGQGLNFYTDFWKISKSKSKSTSLKNSNAYMLELIKISKKERFTTPARFKNYEPKPININIENNSDFPIK